MSNVVLFTAQRAYAASLRGWCGGDARRLAAAILWGRSTEEEARKELAATLAWHAEKADIRTVSCRKLAAAMLDSELAIYESQANDTLQRMIAAAEASLRAKPRDQLAAANAAADIAREAAVPPHLVESAYRIARWRARRRA